MIRIRLADMLARKRLSIVELSDRTGITVRDLEVLRDQGAMALRLRTLDCLCRALSCTPGDILEYSEDEPN
ncbi:helix-turn-helix domain-containing protein [Asticcacaulis solisilvae]|uniref:helix-turn-helix domain-containing protein n=1 Tax=Asticcacaulis solisilvae TaxID=1217274 RepID=UPI003FD76504